MRDPLGRTWIEVLMAQEHTCQEQKDDGQGDVRSILPETE